MVSAIEKNLKSVVSFRAVGQDGDLRLAGVGTIVSADGLVVTAKGNFGVGVLTTTINGIQYALQVLSDERNNTLGLGRLTPVSATSTPVFTSVTLGNPDILKLGQTAIVIGGRDGKTISTGLVASIDTRTVVDKDTKVETTVLDNIGVSMRFAGSSNGAPIITLSGDVVGFLNIDENTGSQIGVSATEAKKIIDEAKKSEVTNKI